MEGTSLHVDLTTLSYSHNGSFRFFMWNNSICFFYMYKLPVVLCEKNRSGYFTWFFWTRFSGVSCKRSDMLKLTWKEQRLTHVKLPDQQKSHENKEKPSCGIIRGFIFTWISGSRVGKQLIDSSANSGLLRIKQPSKLRLIYYKMCYLIYEWVLSNKSVLSVILPQVYSMWW